MVSRSFCCKVQQFVKCIIIWRCAVVSHALTSDLDTNQKYTLVFFSHGKKSLALDSKNFCSKLGAAALLRHVIKNVYITVEAKKV